MFRATSISPTTPQIRSTRISVFECAVWCLQSYTQANTKVNQSYFYQDISWYFQDTWKITPRVTLDFGMRFSYYEPFHKFGAGELLQPQLFDPAKATRLYRPICVGASTCSAGQTAIPGYGPCHLRLANAGEYTARIPCRKAGTEHRGLNQRVGSDDEWLSNGRPGQQGCCPSPA